MAVAPFKLMAKGQSDRHAAMERTQDKLEKSTNQDKNLIIYEGGQDTSACQIQAIHPVLSQKNAQKPHILPHHKKCQETPNFTHFTKSKCRQNEENQQTMTKIRSVLKVIRVHQHAKFQAILRMRSPENDQKPQIWPTWFIQKSKNEIQWLFHDIFSDLFK